MQGTDGIDGTNGVDGDRGVRVSGLPLTILLCLQLIPNLLFCIFN